MFKWLNKLVTSESSGDDAPAGKDSQESAPVEPSDAAVPTPVSMPVSRMILLDRSAKIIGYEFVAKSSSQNHRANSTDGSVQECEGLIRAVMEMGADRIAQFREIWVSVSEATIVGSCLDAMPASATMVLLTVNGHAPANPEAISAAKLLRAKGFRFGLVGFANRAAYLEWLPLIDVVALDINGLAADELAATLDLLHGQRAGLKVLARRIDSYEEYEYCMAKGFDCFSGRFLTHRESWPPQPPLSPDRLRLCGLLNDLRGGGELSDVAAGMKLSPEISYRFLRYINSVGMGASSHIGSLEQGVLYLGREKLYRWLTLLMFNSADGNATDAALLDQALVRGRLLELLGGDNMPRGQRDELFIVGMFSVLDVLLRMPLDLAVRPLQLPGPVTQALLTKSGPYAGLYRLTLAVEDGDAIAGENAASLVMALAAECGLTIEQVNACQLEAVSWAQENLSAQAAG